MFVDVSLQRNSLKDLFEKKGVNQLRNSIFENGAAVLYADKQNTKNLWKFSYHFNS